MKTASIKLFVLRAITVLSGGFFLYAAILEVNASTQSSGAQSVQNAPVAYTDSVNQSEKALPRNKNASSAKTAATAQSEDSKDPLKDVQHILVHLDSSGQLAPYRFPNEGKDIEFIVFYLASGGCPHCRAFSPTLVQTYNALKRESNKFEVVLIDYDRSESDMVNYMRRENMVFPAVQYDLRKQAAITHMYQGISIPTLVIVDRNGNVRYTNANNALRTVGDVLAELSRLVR